MLTEITQMKQSDKENSSDYYKIVNGQKSAEDNLNNSKHKTSKNTNIINPFDEISFTTFKESKSDNNKTSSSKDN